MWRILKLQVDCGFDNTKGHLGLLMVVGGSDLELNKEMRYLQMPQGQAIYHTNEFPTS